MRAALASSAALLLSVVFIMLANGLFGTFIGLRSGLEGFPKEVIGLLASAYYVGLIIGTLRCGRLINRVGHIRAFAAFCAVNAASVLIFTFVTDPAVWGVLRVIIGFNLAGAYIVAESWLNNKATPRTRGTLLSMYMMTTYVGLGSGQFLINIADHAGPTLFIIVGLLISLAVIPVAVTRASHPAPVEEETHFNFLKLYTISPLAVVGCVCAGLTNGALFGMAPIYGQDLGWSVGEISRFMGVLVISGLALQYPIGFLSDRFDRRRVIIAVYATVALVSVVVITFMIHFSTIKMGDSGEIWMPARESPWLMLVIAGVYGSLIATQYPLVVSYANDYIDPGDMVEASAGLVLAFSLGAVFGPPLAAVVMKFVGPNGLFMYTGAIAAFTLTFAIYRTRRRSWVPVMEKESFVPLPEATVTPNPGELDPRYWGIQLELDLEPVEG
ncbi:MAG: MFS transporter [Gammaproteobacteria bacterium]